ncbi:MAG: ABC transporter permease [Deltaproteobacteria bacterium]|nr:ABC transporter permease [Deltaproteobacteria bacterium]
MQALLPVFALWRREMVRFVRQRSRISGAFAQPLVFWLLLGGGLNASFQPAGTAAGTSYVAYFYPGTIALVLLFTAIFSTISTVEDRKAGFLQGVLVAPVPRSSIVLGQAMGGTSLAVIQGMMFLALAPLVGIPLSLASIVSSFLVMCLMALALTSLGLIIAWRMDSTQGFHAIMNLILLPIWFLSGAFFPASGAPAPLRLLMNLDPLTYGMAALRRCLYLSGSGNVGPVPGMASSLLITLIFAAASFAFAVRSASRV